ncbi:Hypothetical predicted protein [Podarcis lilfordi]|uniref:Uncharacterized protein n=1 Tax=Podarcis lilfordi TaxID=74358 RepID=A0AA35K8H1_9SAUR|nr:Hypothetical predicted protein [Podarcis lilfordi]
MEEKKCIESLVILRTRVEQERFPVEWPVKSIQLSNIQLNVQTAIYRAGEDIKCGCLQRFVEQVFQLFFKLLLLGSDFLLLLKGYFQKMGSSGKEKLTC